MTARRNSSIISGSNKIAGTIYSMFCLTREVRFGVNPGDNDEQLKGKPANSFGGFPSLLGIGHYFSLQVTLKGRTNPATGCLLNIKDIDQVVRAQAVPLVSSFVRDGRAGGGGNLLGRIYEVLKGAWPGAGLHSLRLSLSPLMAVTIFSTEFPMVRLSQKFEFSASHRLHNPKLGEEENQRIFGKCNNPHGHGHNYIVEVSVAGVPDADGVIVQVPSFERVVASTVIDRFDHKNLNVEIAEFSELIPTVENIAMVIFRLLKPRLAEMKTKLAGVTVWETPKTWCEYSE